MKLYTKTGDKGTTGLLTGERVSKDSLRVEAYGSVDELSSALGIARAWSQSREVCDTIYKVQKLLMLIMAELASSNMTKHYVEQEHINILECTIDTFDAQLPPLTEFIIPGDSKGGAGLDLARTIARRAERQVVRLANQEALGDFILVALNRISDLCFVLARFENNFMKK